MEDDKKPRKRSNPTPMIEINIGIKVLWNPKEQVLDIRGFKIDPADQLTIGHIGNLLGDNIVAYIVNKTKPAAKLEGKL